MKFAIAVHSSPYASAANHRALRFCASVLRKGHEISRVFFYHHGVYTALTTQVPPQDEANTLTAWQTLAVEHNIELSVCIANALKRGVLSETERARYERSATTLADHFELVGLGQLIDAIIGSDRYIEFPA